MLKFIGAITCVGIGALVLILLFAVGSHGSSSGSSGDTVSATLGPAIRVSAMKLYLDYQANEVQADKAYRGQHLVVTGVVTGIKKDVVDDVYLTLLTDNEFMPVDAHLRENEFDTAAGLHTMQPVQVDCVGGGMLIGSPQLRNCNVVQEQPESPVNALVAPSKPEGNPQPSSPDAANDDESNTKSSISPSATMTEPNDSQMDLYKNERFGFSVRYPRSFTRGAVPENGDGLSFSSPDGAKITVSGSNNDGVSLHEYYEETLKQVPGHAAYTREAGNWFVVSWRADGKVSYLKMFVGSGSVNTLTIEYPDESVGYNTMAEQVEGSFTPGGLGQAW